MKLRYWLVGAGVLCAIGICVVAWTSGARPVSPEGGSPLRKDISSQNTARSIAVFPMAASASTPAEVLADVATTVQQEPPLAPEPEPEYLGSPVASQVMVAQQDLEARLFKGTPSPPHEVRAAIWQLQSALLPLLAIQQGEGFDFARSNGDALVAYTAYKNAVACVHKVDPEGRYILAIVHLVEDYSIVPELFHEVRKDLLFNGIPVAEDPCLH